MGIISGVKVEHMTNSVLHDKFDACTYTYVAGKSHVTNFVLHMTNLILHTKRGRSHMTKLVSHMTNLME